APPAAEAPADIPRETLGPDAVAPISGAIAEGGLAAAEARLALGAKGDPSKLMALGGVRLLRALEGAIHARWRHGLAPIAGVPILRLELPENPSPAPWAPDAVEAALTGFLAQLALAEEALAAAEGAMSEAPDDAIALTVALSDLWFDVNADGRRDAGEDLLTLARSAGLRTGAGAETAIVRFDVADLSWMRAYVHLLSAVAEFGLALEPTAALERLAALDGELAQATLSREGVGAGLDQAAPLWMMLTAPAPDRERTRAALGHLQEMVAQNRVFWTRIGAETDNAGEWIPNPRQASALGGARVPAEAAAAWVETLQNLDKVLKGELLLPHWRYGPTEDGQTVGVNLRRVLTDPLTFDPALWAQGAAAAPYIEAGPQVTGDAFDRFARLVGDPFRFALWFN
ncbi:MAG: hypothetical protein AAFR16_02340, partial [Pseudomonadota bacterium]